MSGHAKREDDDTIRHSIQEVVSKAQTDLEQAVANLRGAAERSEKAARSLLLESRRTRMASRPGMKSPYEKKQ